MFSLVLAACSATEGPLLVRDDSGPGTPPLAAVRSDMSLQYQITGELDTGVQADLFVSDLFETSARQVGALHAAGRLAMAYVSVGTLENWRPDVTDVPYDAVGMPVAEYPDESWLDTRRDEVRALLQARLDLAGDKGFDGVFASTLGVYRAASGFALTRTDELEFAIFVAGEAHARGLSIGQSGDFEFGQELASHFDWAIAVGCVERDVCAELRQLIAAGLPVWDLETSGDHTDVCRQAAAYSIPVLFKNSAFDAVRSSCP